MEIMAGGKKGSNGRPKPLSTGIVRRKPSRYGKGGKLKDKSKSS